VTLKHEICDVFVIIQGKYISINFTCYTKVVTQAIKNHFSLSTLTCSRMDYKITIISA